MKGRVLIISVVVIVVAIVGIFVWVRFFGEKSIACTMEAKLCPDGSYVGRTGPKCEFALCPDEKNGGDISKTFGTLTGKVNIGPLCPVEPCPAPVSNPYISRQIILTPKNGKTPFYLKIDKDGGFNDDIPAGSYELTLSDCVFMGCRYALPKIVVVEAGKTMSVDINIDTGIR